MKIKIPIGPLSVNQSKKRDFHKSAEYLQFERDVCLLLPFNKETPLEGELFVRYVFYIKNYSNSDQDNCVKLIQDILVKRGYFKDDRYIKSSYGTKQKVTDIKDEQIEIDIVSYDKRHVLFF